MTFHRSTRPRCRVLSCAAALAVILLPALLGGCEEDEAVDRFQLKTPEPTATPFGAEVLAFVSVQNSRARIREINRFGSGLLDLSIRTTPSNGQPAWAPDGRQIAFTSARGGSGDIFIMGPDGGNQSRLTLNEAPEAFPAWSPDGERIAFVSRRERNGDIYTIETDGSGEQRLTDDPAVDTAPAWSP
ncbi:MAG TPA: hypothetical protein VFP63_00335, partial [Dehalococcoidia bacterium]|nr:hypothetical protein [Dehalococcoidia bacterium]